MPHKYSTTYTKRTKSLARTLRKRSTPTEDLLWQKLRSNQLDVHFRRQVPIGDYVVDFASLEFKLIIEVDGIQHQSGLGRMADKVRDEVLRTSGFSILRFTNDDVGSSADDVADEILETLEHLRKKRPHPSLPLSGEGV